MSSNLHFFFDFFDWIVTQKNVSNYKQNRNIRHSFKFKVDQNRKKKNKKKTQISNELAKIHLMKNNKNLLKKRFGKKKNEENVPTHIKRFKIYVYYSMVL